MRRMILRMIATGSLSAFSASVLQGTGALQGNTPPAVNGVGGTAGAAIQPVRTSPAPPSAQPQSQPVLDLDKSPSAPAGRVPPRGSLLDLSV